MRILILCRPQRILTNLPCLLLCHPQNPSKRSHRIPLNPRLAAEQGLNSRSDSLNPRIQNEIQPTIAPTCFRHISLAHGPTGWLNDCDTISTYPAFRNDAVICVMIAAGRPILFMALSNNCQSRSRGLSCAMVLSSQWRVPPRSESSR